MTTYRAHRLNVLGLLLLSTLGPSAGCGGDDEQPPPNGAPAHDETPDGGVGGIDAATATISVRGKVLDTSNTPIGGLPVLVGGHPLALTDASGQFTVPNVLPPYTVTVLVGSSKVVVVYEGLSRPDPAIVVIDPSIQRRRAGIQGTLAGGAGYPEPALTRTFVQVAGEILHDAVTSRSEPGQNTFVLPPDCTTWTGPATTHGTLHAIQYRHAAANDLKPIDYKGYGTLANFSLADGDNQVPMPIMLTPIGKVNFSASVTVPSDYAVTEKRPQLTIAGRIVMTLPKDSQAGPDLTYPIPQVGDAKVRLTVSAENASTGATSQTTRTGLALDTTNAAIEILPSSTLVLPVDLATGVNANTSFSWTKRDDAVSLFYLTAGPGKPQYQIVTTATEARLPDLTSAGIELPPATVYQWAVQANAPFASVDAYAGHDIAGRNDLPVLSTAMSAVRSLTTAP